MNHEPIDRRTFIGRATAAGIGLGLMGAVGSTTAQDAAGTGTPTQKLRVAVIGTNGRGLSHIQSLSMIPSVEIAYICDVEDGARMKGINAVAKYSKGAPAPKPVNDFRDVLNDKTIDAVTIAVPDHWHTPMAILALQAGKHVYLEKPCSQNFDEGEMLIKAVAKSGKVFQMGNQRRSFPKVQEVIKQIHQGLIGRAYLGRAWYDNSRKGIGKGKETPVPKGLDYALWQGPAPRVPYKDNVIPYNWHWFWHWGTGEALNNGTHEVDVCRWALNVDFPERVSSNGGRYHITDDDWETPDTQMIGWDFPGGESISWEGRSCNAFPYEKLGRGSIIFGTEGSVLLDGNNYTQFDKKGKVVKEVKSADEDADATNTISASGTHLDALHVMNFIDAVRNQAAVNSPIEEGHKSCALLHLGNIAWRVKRQLNCDPKTGHILNDLEATKLESRTYEPGWEPKV